MACCSRRCRFITFGILAILFFVIAAILQPVIYAIVRSEIKKQLPLTSSSSTLYQQWQQPTVPMYQQFFFWNVTNVPEVLQGAYPNVSLCGPYTYTDTRSKYDISWSDDENIVTYKYNEWYNYINTPCSEVGSTDICSFPEDEMITSVNPPLLGVLSTFASMNKDDNLPDGEAKLLEFLIDRLNKKHNDSETLFITRPVSEWLWGYNDTLLEFLNQTVQELHLKMQVPPPFFSLQENNSATTNAAYSSAYTGKNDLNQVTEFITWAGQGNLSIWNGCNAENAGPNAALYNQLGNMINGTEAFQFAPGVDEDTVLQVFSDQIVRSAFLVYNSSTSVFGIDLLRFVLTPTNFQNEVENEYNCAFSDGGPSGLFNMTAREGAPVFASLPNFLKADPYYRSLINGMIPLNPEMQDTIVDVEPWTGATMSAHQRLQVNFEVQPNANITFMSKIAKGGFFLPVLWADQRAEISEDLADQWKSQIGVALKIAQYGPYAGYGLGGLFSLLFLVVGIMMYRDRKEVARLALNNKYDEDETTPMLSGKNRGPINFYSDSDA